MKHIENYLNYLNEKPNLTEYGSREGGDNRFVYHETAYLHKKTGELWLYVTRYDGTGGDVYIARYDENQEIKEHLKYFK